MHEKALTKKNRLSPSILAADFNILGKQLTELEEAGADFLHIDVMDGKFVPSISFGMPVITSIRKTSGLFFDVHLMIEEPIRYVKEFAECGADLINVHFEACSDLSETLAKIRSCGCLTGITIKPKTPVEAVFPYLDQVDMILLMSVEPGFGGQKLLLESFERLRSLRDQMNQMENPPLLEVDGGITLQNAADILAAGADTIVAGSAVFRGDLKANVNSFRNILDGKSAE